MTDERVFQPVDPDIVEQQFEDMAEHAPAEFEAVKAKLAAVETKRAAKAAPAPDYGNMTRNEFIKLHGFDPGWR